MALASDVRTGVARLPHGTRSNTSPFLTTALLFWWPIIQPYPFNLASIPLDHDSVSLSRRFSEHSTLGVPVCSMGACSIGTYATMPPHHRNVGTRRSASAAGDDHWVAGLIFFSYSRWVDYHAKARHRSAILKKSKRNLIKRTGDYWGSGNSVSPLIEFAGKRFLLL